MMKSFPQTSTAIPGTRSRPEQEQGYDDIAQSQEWSKQNTSKTLWRNEPSNNNTASRTCHKAEATCYILP
jgi:hypothetical protein